MALTLVSASMQEPTAQYTGFKNRIINGAMQIDQRNSGASVTPNNSYTLDRWTTTNSQTSKFTVQQDAGAVTPPVGFTDYLGVTSSSAYSVLAGDYFGVVQIIEGFNVADLGWGTANASPVTLSLWVRSSLTGTFGGSIRNGSGNRSYPFTYTITSANTWEQKSITIVGDTTGTWATNNTNGMSISFGLGAGSTFSGTANAWGAGNFISATGATSVVGTSGATFYITGVQLEKGSTATSFDYLDYGCSLIQCQRYYYRQKPSINVRFCSSYNATTTSAVGVLQLPVTMRTAPSALEQTGTANDYGVAYLAAAAACSSVPVFSLASTQSVYISFTVASGLTAGQGSTLYNNTANGYLGFSAEL